MKIAEVNICSIHTDGHISISLVTNKDKKKFHIGTAKLVQEQED